MTGNILLGYCNIQNSVCCTLYNENSIHKNFHHLKYSKLCMNIHNDLIPFNVAMKPLNLVLKFQLYFFKRF